MRERIKSETKRIKLLQEPWNKVYINRDTHVVYLREDQRVKKKIRKLKEQPGFEHHTNRVKLVKGHIEVDGVSIDKNLFL